MDTTIKYCTQCGSKVYIEIKRGYSYNSRTGEKYTHYEARSKCPIHGQLIHMERITQAQLDSVPRSIEVRMDEEYKASKYFYVLIFFLLLAIFALVLKLVFNI